MGALLERSLKERLGDHPNVADIRGRGLFWGIELVADKQTSRPFPFDAHVASDLMELGLDDEYGIGIYSGSGSADGREGDHLIISPAFNITSDEIRWIAETVARLVSDFFARRGTA